MFNWAAMVRNGVFRGVMSDMRRMDGSSLFLNENVWPSRSNTLVTRPRG